MDNWLSDINEDFSACFESILLEFFIIIIITFRAYKLQRQF